MGEGEEKKLKAAREKKQTPHKETPNSLVIDLSRATLKPEDCGKYLQCAEKNCVNLKQNTQRNSLSRMKVNKDNFRQIKTESLLLWTLTIGHVRAYSPGRRKMIPNRKFEIQGVVSIESGKYVSKIRK